MQKQNYKNINNKYYNKLDKSSNKDIENNIDIYIKNISIDDHN